MGKAGEINFCFLVEDHEATRNWLVGMLSEVFPKASVVAAGSLADARRLLSDHLAKGDFPDIALIDLGLPDGSGLDLIGHFVSLSPQTKRIVTTTYGDDAYLLKAISAGAQGYLLKEEEGARLAQTLRRIERDEPPLSPSIARRMLMHFGDAGGADQPETDEADLTSRERETLTLLARGLTVGEVAAQLGLSPHTVASYAKIIYQKLHVTSRAEATR